MKIMRVMKIIEVEILEKRQKIKVIIEGLIAGNRLKKIERKK